VLQKCKDVTNALHFKGHLITSMQDISKDTEMFDHVNVLLETLAEDECNPVVVPASEAISCCEHMLNTVLSTLFDNKQKTYQKSAVF